MFGNVDVLQKTLWPDMTDRIIDVFSVTIHNERNDVYNHNQEAEHDVGLLQINIYK